jgi:hypothetical protein
MSRTDSAAAQIAATQLTGENGQEDQKRPEAPLELPLPALVADNQERERHDPDRERGEGESAIAVHAADDSAAPRSGGNRRRIQSASSGSRW